VLSVIAAVVAVVLHLYELPAEAVSVTSLPEQNVVAPDAVTVAVKAGIAMLPVSGDVVLTISHAPVPLTANIL
jgi:hypothetical protein